MLSYASETRTRTTEKFQCMMSVRKQRIHEGVNNDVEKRLEETPTQLVIYRSFKKKFQFKFTK